MFNKAYNNIDFLNKALDGSWQRNNTINSNMANANTPNYKRKSVSFERHLKDSIKNNRTDLKTTNKKHIKKYKDRFEPQINTDKSTSYRFDGNNVNIDTESAELAKNNIIYSALTKQVTDEFNKIKSVINEGGR